MGLGFSRDASGERSILTWASLSAQARSREATTHDPPQAPAQRPYHPKAAAGPSRSKPWRRTNHPLAHSAKAPPSSPEPPQRAQARSREATTHDPPRAPAHNDQPTPRRQRDRAGASLGGEQTTPSRTARKLQSSPEPPQRAQARSREALTHDPPQAPAQRLNHPAAAGPGLSVRADNQSRSSTSTKAPVAFSGTGFTTHRRF